MAIEVSDSLSNRPEQIIEAAKIIGRSQLRRSVFEAIYYHKKRSKSVSEIEEITGLTRIKVLQNGGMLANSGLATQEKTSQGICYCQIPFFQSNKREILRLAGDADKIAKVATKRAPAVEAVKGVTFTKKTRRVPTRRRAPSKSVRLKIAFLSTNPDKRSALRTDIEVRNIQKVIRTTIFRDQITLNHVPAAEWEDLLDTLNEFEPDIVHFSGHGGGEQLLFDNEHIYDDGGIELDFDLMHRFIKATKNKPMLLVFNACDTVNGAEIFLESVGAIVAMSDSIDDAAADFFATRFYAAIGNGQSIEHALDQAKASLAADNFQDADFPSLLTTGDSANFAFF